MCTAHREMVEKSEGLTLSPSSSPRPTGAQGPPGRSLHRRAGGGTAMSTPPAAVPTALTPCCRAGSLYQSEPSHPAVDGGRLYGIPRGSGGVPGKEPVQPPSPVIARCCRLRAASTALPSAMCEGAGGVRCTPLCSAFQANGVARKELLGV